MWCRYFSYLNTWHIRIHDMSSYDPILPQLFICFHLSRHERSLFLVSLPYPERSRTPLIADWKIFRFRSMNMFIVDRSISYTFIILNYSNCQISTPFWTFSGISPLKSPKHRNVEMMKLSSSGVRHHVILVQWNGIKFGRSVHYTLNWIFMCLISSKRALMW